MKTNKRERLIPMIVSLSTLVAGVSNSAVANQDVDRAEAVGWLIQHQDGDGSWGQGGVGVAATAEALAALKNAGADKGFHYTRALAWLSNRQADSVDSLARKIIALKNAGVDTAELGLSADLLERGNVAGGWGAYAGYGGGFPDSGLAMEALRAASVTAPVAAYFVLTHKAQGNGSQGWSYWGGELGATKTPVILPTASNVTALSRLYQDGYTGVTYQDVNNQSVHIGTDTQVSRAANWLLAKKQSDGSFMDDGADTGTERTTATAYLALQAAASAGLAPAGTDTALTQAATFLQSRQAADGSWSGDAYATALALRTFPATVMSDGDNDGIPDAW